MRLTSILSLPASILFLITTHTAAAERLANNSPGGARLIADQQGADVRNEQTLPGRSPVGVLKMSDDPGEKFYLEYWQYEEALQQANTTVAPARPLRIRNEEEEGMLLANASSSISYRTPFALHTDDNFALHSLKARGRIPSREAAAAALAALQNSQFQCPTGTSSCASIGYPNSCCGTDESCFMIEDTGLGPVGCCPTGSTCAGTISACNAPNTACAENQGDYEGGGCCIPNYVCAGVGCVPSASPSPSSTTESPGETSTVVVTVTSSAPTTTTTSTTSSSTSSHASVVTTTITETVAGVPPARPTGTTSTISAPPTTSTDTGGSCPTGFYACQAFYAGGCCRTGRDCATTNCPPVSSTTIISSGVTVVVPAGPAATVATTSSANCASGWLNCAASLGGGCCPSGWQCGTASCISISPTSTEVGKKDTPSLGIRSVQGSFCLLLGGLIGVIALI